MAKVAPKKVLVGADAIGDDKRDQGRAVIECPSADCSDAFGDRNFFQGCFRECIIGSQRVQVCETVADSFPSKRRNKTKRGPKPKRRPKPKPNPMQRLEAPIHDAFSIGAIREELVRHGVSIVRVVDDAHAAIIEQDTSHVPMLLREDGGTPHGARGMGGIAKGYGAACDPAVAKVRVMESAYVNLHGSGTDPT